MKKVHECGNRTGDPQILSHVSSCQLDSPTCLPKFVHYLKLIRLASCCAKGTMNVPTTFIKNFYRVFLLISVVFNAWCD